MEGQGLLCVPLKADACPNTENCDAMPGVGGHSQAAPRTGLSAWLYHRFFSDVPYSWKRVLFPRPLSIPPRTKNTSTE